MPESGGWRGAWPTAEALAERARAIVDVRLAAREAERLLAYLQLLERWAAKFNLIAVSSRAEVVDRHLLDSLAVVRLLGSARSVADFGSGAGFPGIPLAVVRPEMKVFLVEARAHRVNFLRHAVRTLGLGNAEVFEGRGEQFAASSVELVVARAVRLDEVADFARSALMPGGRLVSMAKRSAAEPVPDGFRCSSRVEYRLPHGHAHELVELQPIG